MSTKTRRHPALPPQRHAIHATRGRTLCSVARLLSALALLAGAAAPAQAQPGDRPQARPKLSPVRPKGPHGRSWCAYPTRPRRAPDAGGGLRQTTIEETEPNDTPDTAQALPLGEGAGEDRDIDVSGELFGFDLDVFSFSAVKGDVLGVACLGQGGMDPIVDVLDPGGSIIFYSDDDCFFGFCSTSFYPPDSPMPGGVNDLDSALTFIVPESGTYLFRVDAFAPGSYTLQIRSRRPGLEAEEPAPAQQIIFLDFNGETVNALALFGGGSSAAVLSPLRDFLPAWGLSAADENDVIDAILAVFQENFDSLRTAELNGDRDTDGIDGHFDLEIRNSRDHADPFGQSNVARVIIGGTINELGIPTIGIAEFIDPGNFARKDTAVVLLDSLSANPGDPDSLNQFGLAEGTTRIDLIGLAVGNVAAHEAGHFLGCWHTNNGADPLGFCSLNFTPSLMDAGGCIDQIIGIGSDFILGTADDIDVDFVADLYDPFEGVGNEDGIERTDVRVAFALATGAQEPADLTPPVVAAETPARGSTIAALDSVAVTMSEPVTGVIAAALTVGTSAATAVTGSGAGPYTFSGFDAPVPGTVTVFFTGPNIRDAAGNAFTGDAWTYTLTAVDTTPPVVSGESPARGSTIAALDSVAVTMSEPVTGVIAAALTVGTSAATAVTGSGAGPYTFSGFDPPGPGTVTIDFAGDGIQDEAGNDFAGDAWTYTLIVDDTPPVVSGESPARGSTITTLSAIAVTMSESVTGVTAAALTVDGSPASSVSGDGDGPYTFSGFDAPPPGTVAIDFAGDGIQDEAGNDFAGDAWTYTLIVVDDTPPVVSGESPGRGMTITALPTVAVILDEPVTGVTAAALTVNGSAATALTGSDAGPYTFSGFDSPAPGTVTIDFSGTGITDEAGNPFAGDTWTYTLIAVDTTPPDVLGESPRRNEALAALTFVSVLMTEPVTGVTAAALTVNGSAAADVAVITAAGPYTFSGFDPPGAGPVIIVFSGEGIADAAGNPFPGASWSYEVEGAPTGPQTPPPGGGNGGGSPLVLDLGGNRQINPGESLVLGGDPTATGGTPPYVFRWDLRGNPDVPMSSESSPVFGPVPAGIYVVRLIVTDQGGASATGFTTIVVGDGGGPIGLAPGPETPLPGCGPLCAPNMGGLLALLGAAWLLALGVRVRHRSRTPPP